MSEGKNRNKLCPCGSGKKYKKCCMDKKKRITSVTMDMGEPVIINGYKVGADGSLQLLRNGVTVPPVKANIETLYERTKGSKIINKADIETETLWTDLNSSLLKYVVIFAIDTNTRIINNQKISISCIVLCNFITEGKRKLARFAPIQCLEFWNIAETPENIAWKTAIELIIANPAYNNNMKIGLIVDSDLGKIPDYNSRTKPIIGDYYLPLNIELIYASSDVGKEYLPNKLLSECDKEVDRLFEIIDANPNNNSSLKTASNLPYTHFRLWNKT